MKSLIKTVMRFPFESVAVKVSRHIRLMCWLRERGYVIVARYISSRMQRKFGVFISSRAEIAPDLKLPHPIGVVIGDGVRIGREVTLYQGVTVGGARVGDAQLNNYPEILDGTVVFASAVIVGKVRIGKKCIIGANSVVTRDIPDGETAVGVPARILNRS